LTSDSEICDGAFEREGGKLMGIFGKRPEKLQVQTVSCEKAGHPFGELDRYTPFSCGEFGLYKSLRESIPVIDAAIYKIVRLVGGFRVVSEDPLLQKKLNRFLDNIQVNACGRGVEAFVSSFLEQLLTYGTAVGEIVLNGMGNDIAALFNAPLENIELRTNGSPLFVEVCRRDGFLKKPKPVKFKDLILLSALMPQPGKIYGTSILKGLPFVSAVLLKIYNTIGANWERVGNVRFSVMYKSNSYSGVPPREQVKQVADEWRKAMHNDQVCDFISVGDVDIKVIGADNQILDSKIPVRQMLEQITAKLSIPPFLLGLSWSTSEKMSVQQADILTSELESYRRLLTPIINKICSFWMRLQGFDGEFGILWSCINLQEEVELAKARLLRAQAERAELN
jgi:hypothetical protein